MKDLNHQSEIAKQRARTEKRVKRLLSKTGSSATLDDIKTIIFNEVVEMAFSAYLMKLMDFFDDPDERYIDEMLPALQDAWNYFPHRRFNGSCPAAEMLRLAPGVKPRDLRA
ncbi:MAG TPA: hypothetical protein VMF32_00270 [Xanthobacteraceae bacterium]|nr:hypothetical protein [Xanthobacteraceae bacterium]